MIIELNRLKINQEVTWCYTYLGGYGRIVFVKTKVIKLNPKKCRLSDIRIGMLKLEWCDLVIKKENYLKALK